MQILTVVVFLFVYLGMALGRMPALKLDRTGAALVGVVILLGSGAVSAEQAVLSISGPTILLFFSLMIISAQFSLSGFYDLCAARITAGADRPAWLLGAVTLVAGILSALLSNDVVVFAMAPLLCRGLGHRGVNPKPYLLALTGAANAGSAATLIGNPQNIVIGQVGALDFLAFFLVCAPAAIIALVIVYFGILWIWRCELRAPANASPIPSVAIDRRRAAIDLTALAGLLVYFLTPLRPEIGALALAAVFLLGRRTSNRAALAQVDWRLLLLLICLFVVTHGFVATDLARDVLQKITEAGFWPDRLKTLAPAALLLSNTIGNVPAVVLLTAVWPSPPDGALYAFAILSTLAGNFLLVGSLANIITAERAAAEGISLTFADFARAGVPITLASVAVACIWLWQGGWIIW